MVDPPDCRDELPSSPDHPLGRPVLGFLSETPDLQWKARAGDRGIEGLVLLQYSLIAFWLFVDICGWLKVTIDWLIGIGY